MRPKLIVALLLMFTSASALADDGESAPASEHRCHLVGDTEVGRFFELLLQRQALESRNAYWRDLYWKRVQGDHMISPERPFVPSPRQSVTVTTTSIARYKDQTLLGKTYMRLHGAGPGDALVSQETTTRTEGLIENWQRNREMEKAHNSRFERQLSAVQQASIGCREPIHKAYWENSSAIIEMDEKYTQYMHFYQIPTGFSWPWSKKPPERHSFDQLTELMFSGQSALHPVVGVDYHWTEASAPDCAGVEDATIPSIDAYDKEIASCLELAASEWKRGQDFRGGVWIP